MKSEIIYPFIAIALVSASCTKHDNKPEQQLPEIEVSKAIRDSVTIYNTYPGTLRAQNRVDLVGRVNGYLRSKNYDDGQFVTKGRILFTIEDTQYRDQVNQARAALASARSQREYARSHYDAVSEALKSDAVSLMEVKQAKSNLEQAEASIRTAEAELQNAVTNLGYCVVRAPFSGHVSASTLDVGAYVSGAGAPVTLATIYEDNSLYAEFHIDDKAMQKILLSNDKAGIDLDSIPLLFRQDVPGQYTARLSYISPQVDPSTGTLSLRADVDNRNGDLRDGMYVDISLPSSASPDAVLVRDASLGTDQLGKYLFVVNDSSEVVYTPVTTGSIVQDSMRIIVSGIKAGDRYVTKALLKVRDGMTIKPVETK